MIKNDGISQRYSPFFTTLSDIAISAVEPENLPMDSSTRKSGIGSHRKLTSWPADFADACDRHWEDGESLYGNNGWANADHLYGMAAECGLKAVMKELGMVVDSMGVPAHPHRTHIDDLWDRFTTFATSREGATYAAMLPNPNPFFDWSVHQRYAHRSNFIQNRVSDHRNGASRVREVVSTVAADGRM